MPPSERERQTRTKRYGEGKQQTTDQLTNKQASAHSTAPPGDHDWQLGSFASPKAPKLFLCPLLALLCPLWSAPFRLPLCRDEDTLCQKPPGKFPCNQSPLILYIALFFREEKTLPFLLARVPCSCLFAALLFLGPAKCAEVDRLA